MENNGSGEFLSSEHFAKCSLRLGESVDLWGTVGLPVSLQDREEEEYGDGRDRIRGGRGC